LDHHLGLSIEIRLSAEALFLRKNRTPVDVLGHAADVWGSRAMSSCLARHHRDDLAIADDLVLPMNA
jgi:hypothetical protein